MLSFGCAGCRRIRQTEFIREAQMGQVLGCQECRLRRTLRQASPEVAQAIAEWLVRSGQGRLVQGIKAQEVS